MTSAEQHDYRFVCWNGIRLSVPASWEATVSGLHHLHFETGFEAVMEMRWHSAPPHSVPGLLHSSTRQYQELTGGPLNPAALPSDLVQSLTQFNIHGFAGTSDRTARIVFLYHIETSTFVMLQYFQRQSEDRLWQCLKTMECASANDRCWNWSIQDFRASVPADFTLMSYTMDAGISALHFARPATSLHLCRLAPAGIRLQNNSLKDIFLSLLGLPKDISPELEQQDTLIRFQRSPGLCRQIALRLKRKKPFVLASLRHDRASDRLLGVFLEGTQPLDVNLHSEISANYEIIPA